MAEHWPIPSNAVSITLMTCIYVMFPFATCWTLWKVHCKRSAVIESRFPHNSSQGKNVGYVGILTQPVASAERFMAKISSRKWYCDFQFSREYVFVWRYNIPVIYIQTVKKLFYISCLIYKNILILRIFLCQSFKEMFILLHVHYVHTTHWCQWFNSTVAGPNFELLLPRVFSMIF